MMKICIPTMDDRGLEGKVSGHFGSAPFFTLVDTESGACETISKGAHGHEHGACDPVDLLTAHNLDAVVCRGMGRGAIMKLGQAGLNVLVAESENVSEVVAAARSGSLRPLSAQDACASHQHGHDHGQGGSHCGS
jgi:predicted Fe-Mo cluster-binding NifX family protein